MPTKTQEQGARTREHILDAAERLMATHGYDGTSIAAMRKESGALSSSIYWHFGSKQGVLAAVMDRAAHRYLEDDPSWDDVTGEPVERLAKLFDLHAQRLDDHPEFLRLFLVLALTQTEPAVDEVVKRLREDVGRLFELTLERAFAGYGPQRARDIAARLRTFTMAQWDGAFIAAHLDPDLDLRRQLGQLHTALLALAEQEARELARPRSRRR